MTDVGPTTDIDRGGERSLKIGLALGSGGARGWCHLGVLRALEELAITPDVITGSSAGALAGGAHLLGCMDEFAQWALELGPLGALKTFSLLIGSKGGMIDTAPAFEAFREFDRGFDQLPIPFGVVTTNLATGRMLNITSGESVLRAIQASTAVPALLGAVEYDLPGGTTWLVDGGIQDPVPVQLARDLGADIVIAININSEMRNLERFGGTESRAVELREVARPQGQSIREFIDNTRKYLSDQISMQRAKKQARPHLFETGIASYDVVHNKLTELHFALSKPDLIIAPNAGHPPVAPTAFQKSQELTERGHAATMAVKDTLLSFRHTRIAATGPVGRGLHQEEGLPSGIGSERPIPD